MLNQVSDLDAEEVAEVFETNVRHNSSDGRPCWIVEDEKVCLVRGKGG